MLTRLKRLQTASAVRSKVQKYRKLQTKVIYEIYFSSFHQSKLWLTTSQCHVQISIIIYNLLYFYLFVAVLEMDKETKVLPDLLGDIYCKFKQLFFNYLYFLSGNGVAKEGFNSLPWFRPCI